MFLRAPNPIASWARSRDTNGPPEHPRRFSVTAGPRKRSSPIWPRNSIKWLMNRRLNILIIYTSNQYPMRVTLWDELYSFRHYSDHNCFYLNLSVRRVPWYLKRIKFDLIVFGTLFLA